LTVERLSIDKQQQTILLETQLVQNLHPEQDLNPFSRFCTAQLWQTAIPHYGMTGHNRPHHTFDAAYKLMQQSDSETE